MADVYVVFDPHALAELFESPNGPTGKFLAKAVISVERSAKRLCPVDTGRLRSSITHELGHQGTVLVGRVGTNVEYAPYVELGTRRMRAQPFLRPALATVGSVV